MNFISFSESITLSFSIFFIGIIGVLFHRGSMIRIIIAIELILLSIGMNFVIFSSYLDRQEDYAMILFLIVVAAAESAVGLSIILHHSKIHGNINVQEASSLRG